MVDSQPPANPPKAPSSFNLTRIPRWAWFAIGLIIIIGLIAASYFCIFRGDFQFSRSNKNLNANTQAAVNNANSAAVANTNIGVNANTAANINSNQNTNKVVDAEPVTVSKWQTTTYQRAEHGFTIATPADWNTYISGTGFNERQTMINSSTYFSGSDSVEGGSLSLSVTYYVNSESTLTDWVQKHAEEFKTAHQTVNSTKQVGQALVAYSEQTGNSKYLHVYGYIARGTKVYELAFSGDSFMFTKYDETIKHIWDELAFIDPLPVVTVAAPAAKTKISTGGYELAVDWLAEPEPVNFDDPMLHVQSSGDSTGYLGGLYYRAGTVTNGEYKGDDLVVMLLQSDGMAFTDTKYRAVYDQDTGMFTYLEKYSDDMSYNSTPVKYDTVSSVPDLDFPETISIPDSKVKLMEELFTYNETIASQLANATKMFTDSVVGDVYLHLKRRCFMVRLPDGLTKMYRLDVPFATEKLEGEKPYQRYSPNSVPEIEWYDTTTNSVEYSMGAPTGMCGSRQCNNIYLSDELTSTDLELSGQTQAGDPVYEYKNKENDELKKMYKDYTAYGPYDSKGNKLEPDPYETFVSTHPLFFWKGPLNLYVRFDKASFLPMVECGKPVIYLYPTTKTDVNVQVAPTGGFSITDPVYPTGGWNVTAYPDGKLVTRDGAYYPYLFWEGVGFNYKMPERGFVVESQNVKNFLAGTLGKLGLSGTEAKDFMDFWVPRMQEKPYYFITFVDQAFFNQLAPLQVTPRPDTVIRVFMDYRGLDNPMSVEPLEIKTPARRGFTVVEWGGALHD